MQSDADQATNRSTKIVICVHQPGHTHEFDFAVDSIALRIDAIHDTLITAISAITGVCYTPPEE